MGLDLEDLVEEEDNARLENVLLKELDRAMNDADSKTIVLVHAWGL